MDTQIVIVYCICDDILRSIRHYEDPQCQMSDAEVLTTAIVALRWFGSNYESARNGYVSYNDMVPLMPDDLFFQ